MSGQTAAQQGITQIGDFIRPWHDGFAKRILNPEQQGLEVVLRTEKQCREADQQIRQGRYVLERRADSVVPSHGG